ERYAPLTSSGARDRWPYMSAGEGVAEVLICYLLGASLKLSNPKVIRMSMNTLRRYKHAILLAALVCVVLIESCSHRPVLGPVLSDLFITTMLLLVFLIVFERRVNRLVACIALATAVVVGWVRYLLPDAAELPLRVLYHSAVLLLVGFATCVILRDIFAQRAV